MGLVTWEEKYQALTRRIAALEIEVGRIKGTASTGEGLQDRMNGRLADRLKKIEAILGIE